VLEKLKEVCRYRHFKTSLVMKSQKQPDTNSLGFTGIMVNCLKTGSLDSIG
jgi:hypothetical protein